MSKNILTFRITDEVVEFILICVNSRFQSRKLLIFCLSTLSILYATVQQFILHVYQL